MQHPIIRNRPNTVSESTVSDTELSEFFGPYRVPEKELSEFLSAYYLCAKAKSPSFSQNSPSLPQNSVRLSEFSSWKGGSTLFQDWNPVLLFLGLFENTKADLKNTKDFSHLVNP